MKLTKKQQKANKIARHKLTKAYAEEQAEKEIKQTLKLWKLKVRELAGNKCEVCGATGLLNPHHILPKERYQEFQAEPNNGVLLCISHHKYGKYSAHRNPIWFVEFLKKNKPLQYEWALNHI